MSRVRFLAVGLGLVLLALLLRVLLAGDARTSTPRAAPAPEAGPAPLTELLEPLSGLEARETPPSERVALLSAAPTWRADPTREELLRWLAPCEDQSLCGVVLLGIEPFEGARVELWPAESVPAWRARLLDSALVTTSDARGRFGISGLASGEYYLRVTGPGGVQRGSLVRAPGGSYTVVFGGACVDGIVLDERGEPVADVPVRLAGLGDLGSVREAETLTDAAGRFELCALPGGVHWLLLGLDSAPSAQGARSPTTQWRIRLASGERRSVRLSQAERLARFSGRVLDAGGSPVNCALRIEDAQGLWWTASVGAERTFALDLPPGRIGVWFLLGDSNLLESGFGPVELELPADGLVRDLEFPGIEVELRLGLEGETPGQPPGDLSLWLQLGQQGVLDRPTRYREGDLRRPWTLRGMEPGPCTLVLGEGLHFVESGTRQLTFTIPRGVKRFELEAHYRPSEDGPR